MPLHQPGGRCASVLSDGLPGPQQGVVGEGGGRPYGVSDVVHPFRINGLYPSSFFEYQSPFILLTSIMS